MRWFSLDEITRVPLRLRICSFERLIMPWRLRVWPCLILPFAVNLKRFLAPDFVFILGISRLPWPPRRPSQVRVLNPLGMPFWPRPVLSKEAALYWRGEDLQAAAVKRLKRLP